ncbi:methyltransferase domain-containing protein [Nocardiopsis lucentensis]|uniref:methyltransferase domain-containing protein n=1 Tax=Nocardiopsis lucentensis TaxID=53441 RepID=UPI000348C75E|nr:methyltransferase domain-containing protein [Nocardiopsis lucentensis]
MNLNDLHDRLVAGLETSEEIRAAFAAHPRHRYIPDMIWPSVTGLPLFRTADPERWARIVYADDAVTTQANDGGSGPRNEPSSSSSAPQLMADMIAAARIRPGTRVLEIGTGTGWNAAILSSLVGPTGAVTSVEIDPDVASAARERLAGTRVRVITGTEAPGTDTYDALIATCSVSRVPVDWLDRVGLESLIVTPWAAHSHWQHTPVVALRKTGWTCARGPFALGARFMHDRTQRVPDPDFPGLGRRPEATDVVPFTSDEVVEGDLLTCLMLMLPGVRIGAGVRPFAGGHGRIVYLGTPEGSWAYLWPDGTVHSGGRENLVDRLSVAYTTLKGVDGADVTAFSLEVNPPSRVCHVRSAFGEWDHGTNS